MNLCLASQSPRRRELLTSLGYVFDVIPADVDESARSGEAAQDLVERLSLTKAQAVEFEGAVLAADTLVVKDGQVLSKPVDQQDFNHMMSALSGRQHQVLTAFSVVCQGEAVTQCVETQVHFAALSQAQIDAYWQSGEPRDKAGGYGIQGLAGLWVTRIDGSYSNVVGLPLREVAIVLAKFGINPTGIV